MGVGVCFSCIFRFMKRFLRREDPKMKGGTWTPQETLSEGTEEQLEGALPASEDVSLPRAV
jgi:hypothetical protein